MPGSRNGLLLESGLTDVVDKGVIGSCAAWIGGGVTGWWAGVAYEKSIKSADSLGDSSDDEGGDMYILARG
jgi:hypothetical protein